MDAPLTASRYPHGLPTKRMAAAALLLAEDGRLLIVKPHYRPHWLLPGGVVERDESPRQACARETLEELGLAIAPLRLLCVDYTAATAENTESLQFVFWSGYLSAAQLAAIRLQAEELTEWRLATLAEASALLSPRLARAPARLPRRACHRHGRGVSGGRGETSPLMSSAGVASWRMNSRLGGSSSREVRLRGLDFESA